MTVLVDDEGIKLRAVDWTCRADVEAWSKKYHEPECNRLQAELEAALLQGRKDRPSTIWRPLLLSTFN